MLLPALVALLALVLPQASQAGTIFTNQAAFNAAVIGLTLSWSEDFEGFQVVPQTPIPVPTIIGDGSAELAKSGTANIVSFGPTLPGSGKRWFGFELGFGETIQGLAGASLGVSAFGFEYRSELEGSYSFHHDGGVDSDALMPSLTPLFVGWVGSSGELLDFVDYTPGTSAHVLDDIVAYVVPEPSTALLFSGGLIGIAAHRRSRPNQTECRYRSRESGSAANISTT